MSKVIVFEEAPDYPVDLSKVDTVSLTPEQYQLLEDNFEDLLL